MRRLLLILVAAWPLQASAYSTVFDGDPINPADSRPYEMMPGFPLLEAGLDGIVGTADDVITSSVIGDIDMVVRSGSPAATSVIPAPQIQAGRASVPVGVAGSSASGGTSIPFTVFLSDGLVDGSAPFGHLLAAVDMDAMPVVVAAFADFDGDGFIGPVDSDSGGTADNHREIRELEAVGRGVAVFSGGVARGEVAVQAGLPASLGGLGVVLGAVALTGPFDSGFYNGEVPSGPAISTALPFLPQNDLTRVFRDRAVAVSPNTTLQQVIRFAAVPSSQAPAPFALPLDGSSPTVDVAVVNSQSAIRADLFEDVLPIGVRRPISSIVFGTKGKAAKRSLRLAPADRWGNPADPPVGLTASLVAADPLKTAKPSGVVSLTTAEGVVAKVKLRSRTADGASGALVIEAAGVAVGAVPFTVDVRMNPPRADASVPSRDYATIQAAIAGVYDKRKDGALVIQVAPGLYRENVVLDRAIQLRGSGAEQTLIQGDGTASAISLTASGASAFGLAAVGGGIGVEASGANVGLTDVEVWRSVGHGISIAATGAALSRVDVVDNGGNGLSLNANSAQCVDAEIRDNMGLGVVSNSTSSALLADSLLLGNGLGGIQLLNGSQATVRDNRLGNNIGIGIEASSSHSNQITGNLVVLSDGDGLKMDRCGMNLVSLNVFDQSGGDGMYIRRSDGDDDFSAAVGQQAAPGDNTATNSRRLDVEIRTN